MPTLAEIAELEQIVLFHSNINRLKSFAECIFDARKYADLNRDVLVFAQERLKEFLNFVQSQNTFTVEDAIKEFEYLTEIIRKKQEFLSQNQGRIQLRHQYANEPKRLKSERNRLISKYQMKGEQKQSLFDQISDVTLQIDWLLKSKVYKPEDKERHRLLYENIIRFFSDSNPKIVEKPQHISLYAASFYLSIYQQMPVALVVRGKEFMEGFVVLSQKFLEERISTHMRQNLRQYPIKMYVGDNNNKFRIVYTTQNEKLTQAVNP